MKTLPVALQIYSVRDYAEKDFADTLQQVKDMGYDGVELAGLYGLTPEAVRAALDSAGIPAISAHVPIEELMENPEATVAGYKTIGCRYIAIPYLQDPMRPGAEDFPKTLEIIKNVGRICKENGITLLYHNHDFEFEKLPDGTFGLDHIYEVIPADLLQTELDTCWIRVAGQDPEAYVKKYAGRCPVVHLKDYTTEGGFEFCPVGHGEQHFPPIMAAAVEGGAQWLVVEQDRSVGRTTLEAARMGREYLKGAV